MQLGITALTAYLPDNNFWLFVIRYLHRSYTIVTIVIICYRQIVVELQKQHSSVLSPQFSYSLATNKPYISNYRSGFVNKTSSHITDYSSSECISKLRHSTASRKFTTNSPSKTSALTSSITTTNFSRAVTTYTDASTELFSDVNSVTLEMSNISGRKASSGWYYGPVNNYRPLAGPRPPIHRIDTAPDTNTNNCNRQYYHWNRSYVPLNQYNLNSLPLTDNYLRVTQWLKQYVYPRLEHWRISAELNCYYTKCDSNNDNVNYSNRSSTPIPGTNIPFDDDNFEDVSDDCHIKFRL